MTEQKPDTFLLYNILCQCVICHVIVSIVYTDLLFWCLGEGRTKMESRCPEIEIVPCKTEETASDAIKLRGRSDMN